jgi:hypothetical protein
MKIFDNIRLWWGGQIPQNSKIEKLAEWSIQPDITAYELSFLTVHVGFFGKEHFNKWYDELPSNVKRHIKKL